MTVHLTGIELFWIVTNIITTVLTVVALADAHADWAVLRQFNGSARGVVARGNIRRERIRLLIQVAFLVIAIPAALTARETPISFPLLAFLSVPLLLLLNTLSDRRDRGILADKLSDEILHERLSSRERLVAMEDRLNAKADERAGIVSDQATELHEVAADTHERVVDIQERTP